MMAILDAHSAVEKLRKLNFTKKQAEGIVEIQLSNEHNVVTKHILSAELASLEAKLTNRMYAGFTILGAFLTAIKYFG